MVGPSQMQPQTLISPEEEALKRNTDCVYFLASPLTCKKGAECEYRHSEVARVNPRDCWYWLNGSCLNPKCAFRHPPLEGMLGPQVPAAAANIPGPIQQTQITNTHVVSSAPSSQNSGKQAVPCIFFQKGFCLKGDRCPFSHGPSPVVSAPAFTDPSTLKKPFVGLERCSTEPNVVQAYKPTTNKAPFQAKQPPFSETAKNEPTIEYRLRNSPLPANGDLIGRTTNRVLNKVVRSPDDYDTTFNIEDAEEISREPSPGFDVLVDDELRGGSDYYQDEDRYERRSREDRCLTPVNDYKDDYDSLMDTYRVDPRHTRGQYGRDQRMISSERFLGGSDRIDGSDLRNRLLKHRKVNGLRSVVSHDLDRDGGDESYRVGSSRRITHHLPASERLVSDRLRGRIKLPGRSTSPLNERERERGNNGRGRIHDRIKGRVHEDSDDGGRDFRGPRTREMFYNENNVNFAGPKSLSQLRGGRKGDEYNNKQHPASDYQQKSLPPLGKRKYSEAENNVSFEGPKPLSEILKRKRRGDDNNDDENNTNGGNKSSKQGGEESKATDQQTVERNASDVQMEEGLIVDDEAENEEHEEEEEAYAEGEGEYEYEQVDGEEYKEDEPENAEEGEYAEEEDDGDDFAKKIGVMFS